MQANVNMQQEMTRSPFFCHSAKYLSAYSRQGGVVLRYNFPLEEHASQVYTWTMFEMFGQALHRAGRYDVEEVQRGTRYLVRHVEAEKQEKWCREMHAVDVHDGGTRYTCECGLFEHMGMLCCHAIKVNPNTTTICKVPLMESIICVIRLSQIFGFIYVRR